MTWRPGEFRLDSVGLKTAGLSAAVADDIFDELEKSEKFIIPR